LVRDDGTWRVATVQVGELHRSGAAPDAVEILSGLRAGDQVVSQGAILLKPFIVEAVQKHGSRGAGGA
jgi:hypothetical protein